MEIFQRTTIVEQIPQVVDCAYIQGEISQARDRILSQWQNNGRQVRSFEPEFDRVCYVTLGRFKDTNTEAYLEAKQQLDTITETNLKTTVGERLNASLSQWEYDLQEDGIYAQGTTEKAIEMYRRGRNFRRAHGKEVDFAREDAELEGFSMVDEEIANAVIVDPETGELKIDIPEGTMWASFTHRGKVEEGSIYSHNFYDILTLKVRDGKYYIESRRYASALTPEDSIKKITQIDPEQFEDAQPTAEYLLAHPVKFSPQNGAFENADELHAYLHKNIDKTLTTDQYEFVLKRIKPQIKDYLDGLTQNPYDSLVQLANLRGILNVADATADMLVGDSGGSSIPTHMKALTPYEVTQFKRAEVKAVATGCGFSGDYGSGGENPQSAFSLTEFSKFGEKILCCTCPFCKQEVEAVISGGRIKCPNCRESASYSEPSEGL